MDWEHRHAVMALIIKEFADTQVLITTQDERWFMDNTFPSAGKKISLSGWSLQGGPSITTHRADVWTEVEDKLAQKDYASVNLLLRQVLNKTLDVATRAAGLPHTTALTELRQLCKVLLSIAKQNLEPDEVIHALSIVLDDSKVTAKLLGDTDPAKTVTVGDLRGYIQGLIVLERYLVI
ncbi:MAG: hypothetical protein KGZ53_08765 [Peptococcaceae bacterium]|nr:hypothetical protein [Peptococcaceae bacterium]